RRSVEAVPRLDPERRPPPERQPEGGAPERQRADERDPGRDRTEPEPARRGVERAEAAREPEDEQHEEVEGRLDRPEAGSLPDVGAYALQPRRVVHAAKLGRQLASERAQVERVGDAGDGEVGEERGEDDRGVDVHVVARWRRSSGSSAAPQTTMPAT